MKTQIVEAGRASRQIKTGGLSVPAVTLHAMAEEAVADPLTIVERACVAGADASLRYGGICPEPQIHLFIDDWDPSYVGYVRTRPYHRGADAADAIRALGLAAAAVVATSVMVVWEADDLRASLDEPGQHNNGLACVAALPDGTYGLHWHPFELHVDTDSPRTPAGLPAVYPAWGEPASFPDVELPQVIQDLLYQWRTADPDPRELFARLKRDRYPVRLVER